MKRVAAFVGVWGLLAGFGCDRTTSTEPGPTPSASAVALSAPSASASGISEAGAPSGLPTAELARLFREVSEPDKYFFSDNYISNETSYLQVASKLATRARKGGAYIGVGPEQNFTYIALTEPKLAFIVDIRRANAVEHLFYKALFEVAENRAEFLALLTARPYAAANAPTAGATIEDVMAFVEKAKPDAARYAEIGKQVEQRIKGYGIDLGTQDLKTLEQTRRAFFDKQLDLTFELHEKNGRKYPTLRALISQKDPDDAQRSFLASEASFLLIKKMQHENRIVPIVGDFAGEQALKKIGDELRRRDLPVSVFYVSNVEQYLLEPEKWTAWVKNVKALPASEQSLFLRCYLDQGKRHPQQLAGHRTTSVLSTFDHFKWRDQKSRYKNLYELSTEGVL